MDRNYFQHSRLFRQRINWLSGQGNYAIDWSHPMTRNLVRAFLPGVEWKDYANARDATTGITYNDTFGACRLVGMKGAEYNSPGNSTGKGLLLTNPVFQNAATNVTIFALCRVPNGATAGGSGAAVYCERQATGGTIVKLNYDTRPGPQGTNFQIVFRNDSAQLLDLRGTLSQNDGVWHTWCGTKAGNTGSNNVSLYKDGVGNALGTWNFTENFANTLVPTIGYDVADTTGNFQGSIACIYCWKRVLSAVEILYLTRDPFAFFVPVILSPPSFLESAPADFSLARMMGLVDIEY